MTRQEAVAIGEQWFQQQGWEPFPFQKKAWNAYLQGYNGIVNAPTGTGKTYSLGVPALLEFIKQNKDYKNRHASGLQIIWITPIRALAKEIHYAMERACAGLEVPWTVGIRTGDTSTAERTRQKKQMPELLITTPESLHVLFATKGYERFFKNLKAVVVDEWHELMGSKRGVQVELALSQLKAIQPKMKTWGISATIGNMDEALDVLLGNERHTGKTKLIRSKIKKELEVISILPDEIERYPWAGHLGIRLLEKVIPIIERSTSTLIFTNTRSQSEIWYQKILEVAPDLAGQIAMHHGSISREIRGWVEDALHEGKLKAVVCTSSLDLGVDFRPVETIIQIGGPKGIARFIQRAGRSGHQPGATSTIYFLPTNSLELIESAAMRTAIKQGVIEDRLPYIRSFDVLIQYMLVLAVSDGFNEKQLYQHIKTTFAFESIDAEEWQWLLRFITTGGESLWAYDDYKKVEIVDGLYKVTDRRIARQIRLSIGTIVSAEELKVKFISGGYIGSIEEYFISQMKPGDVFSFAGRMLELVTVKGMDALVRKSKAKKGRVPSWMGNRMPLSSQLSDMLRLKMNDSINKRGKDIEIKTIWPLLKRQQEESLVPAEDEFLIEKLWTKEGCHVYMYPFEGRFVHEGMASLIAYRIGLFKPISFSIALNDYGFELLSDQDIPIEDAIDSDIFTPEHLYEDIIASINAAEMARRKFRDIADISGLIFKGFPGKQQKTRHLQTSAGLLFEVFREHEPGNLLYRQAYEEVMEFQLEETRMRRAMTRIHGHKIVLKYPERPTPFSFPIMVDRLSREKVSTESLQDRVRKMKLDFEVE